MSSPTTGLLSTVVASLEEHGTTYHLLEDGCLCFQIAWDRGTHQFLVSTNEELELVTCVVTVGPRVPDDRRLAAAEAVTRINSKIGVGHFELDFDDGELKFRLTIDVDGGLLTARVVDCMVQGGLWACERYVGALMAVAFGGDEPVLAVAAADADA